MAQLSKPKYNIWQSSYPFRFTMSTSQYNYITTTTGGSTWSTATTSNLVLDKPDPPKTKRKKRKLAFTSLQNDIFNLAASKLDKFGQAVTSPVDKIDEDDIDLDLLPPFAASNELYSKNDIDEMQESGETGQDPIRTDDILKANLVSSRVSGYRKHRILLDIDYPAALVPSSTEGHYHLYIDHLLNDEDMEKLVKVLEEIGLIAEGNANQWWRHKALFLRLPWIKKKVEDVNSTS